MIEIYGNNINRNRDILITQMLFGNKTVWYVQCTRFASINLHRQRWREGEKRQIMLRISENALRYIT